MRTQKTVDGVTTEYYTVGGKLLAEKTGDRVLTFHYDEKGIPVSVELNGTRYFYCLNLQGDVVGLKTSSSYDQLVVEYTYDPWGKLLNITDTSGTDIGALNPLRYRGYYYDTETGFYFLQSRYYDPTVGRFINADGQLSGVGGDMQGYNLFAYCQNDPVNMSDPTGHWPKWLSGVLNVVSGVTQMAAGAALGAFAGWTGIGAVAAGLLVVNGATTTMQGVGQIINAATKSSIMREDNIAKTATEDIGRLIGGNTGARIAGGAYDAAVTVAGLYAGRVGLQQAGKIPVRVKTNSLIPDPSNPMTADGINYWTKTLSQNGFRGYNSLPNAYGVVEPICVQRGTMIIANGHHRVAVLSKYGVETIKVFLVP